jgi:uncharacterized protein YndB with AHSA1/START domain
MNAKKHVHEEFMPASPEDVFALLHTPSAIRSWWSAARAIVLPEVGGLWAAAWGEQEDSPEYVTVATIRVFDPPRHLVLSDYRYRAKEGPLPFEADFVTEFVVSPHEQGAFLSVIQHGFPPGSEADEFISACEKGWSDTFAGIRKYLEFDSSVT